MFPLKRFWIDSASQNIENIHLAYVFQANASRMKNFVKNHQILYLKK